MGLLLPDSLTESVAKGTACLPEKGLIVNVVAGIAYLPEMFYNSVTFTPKAFFFVWNVSKNENAPFRETEVYASWG